MCKKKLAVSEQNILDSYYADNAKKLHKAVDKILYRFGGLSSRVTENAGENATTVCFPDER